MAKAITNLTLCEIKKRLETEEISSLEVVSAFRDAYEKDKSAKDPVNGFVEWFDDAERSAEETDRRRSAGEKGILLGLPLAIKDNIQIAGKSATCASRILQGFTAPYSATAVELLKSEGAIFLGRTNMDEFAMGSSCEYSCYGPTLNPWDRSRIAGGSSGGSAAVVAAGHAPFALGSDTGGSIRLPASFCGVYGLKPTYGAISRYGLIAFGSSLDQIGFLASSPQDLALVLSVAARKDPRDSTSVEIDGQNSYPLQSPDMGGLRVGVPAQLKGDRFDQSVREKFDDFCTWLADSGVVVEEFSLPILDACVALYYIIAPAEASSNLSRYDGVKYGHRSDQWTNLLDMYEKTRNEGFGREVKRRILIGNYVLSSGYYDAYYKKAQAVRSLLKKELKQVFESYDMILSPTSPTPAFKVGEKTQNPLAMYLTDVCTTMANLTNTPSLSMPAGRTADDLPVGVQITGPAASDSKLLQLAARWHRESES